MTSVNVAFDTEAMRALVGESILASITDEMRKDILTQAVAQLTTVPKAQSYYDRSVSPLQKAFNDAVSNVANELAKELIEEDPSIRERVKSAMVSSLNKALKADVLDPAITSAIRQALRDGDDD